MGSGAEYGGATLDEDTARDADTEVKMGELNAEMDRIAAWAPSSIPDPWKRAQDAMQQAQEVPNPPPWSIMNTSYYFAP